MVVTCFSQAPQAASLTPESNSQRWNTKPFLQPKLQPAPTTPAGWQMPHVQRMVQWCNTKPTITLTLKPVLIHAACIPFNGLIHCVCAITNWASLSPSTDRLPADTFFTFQPCSTSTWKPCTDDCESHISTKWQSVEGSVTAGD